MFDAYLAGALKPMSLFSDSTTIVEVARSLPHLVRSIQIDDSSVSVLALLAGIIGGWTLTGLRQQLKAKRVRLDARKREQQARRRQD
jgi:hypothetical protein